MIRLQKPASLPGWMWLALMSVAFWGLWGFLAKIGTDGMNARALQVLFVVGMIPPLLLALIRVRFVVQKDRLGIVYGILNGVLATFGMLAFYTGMAHGKASLVAPMASIFPLFTVAGAVFFLKEKLNKIQWVGIGLAIFAVVLFAQ